MDTIFKLAWRNIWRSKRRTLITASSVLLAVLLSILMVSIQKGAWDQMINNVVNFYYGFAQIHKEGYWEDQAIDNAFSLTDELKKEIVNNQDIIDYVPRIESFALAAFGDNTNGVLVVGTDPEKENLTTNLRDKIIDGKYLSLENDHAVISEGLASKMRSGVGDTVVLISQGYHGVNAAGKYHIGGIVKFGSPELNKQMVYLPLPVAQYLFGAEDLVTTLALNIAETDDIQPAVAGLKNSLPVDQYEIMEWKELMPELVEAQEVDAAGNYIVLIVLYIIIGFGIFGTILMMTKEREYEFGVLTSIGMSRWKLFTSVWLEIVFLGLLGAFIGILISIPIVYYFNVNPLDFSEMSEGLSEAYEQFGFEPIFPASLSPMIFINQAIIIFIITTFLATYPFFKIMKLDPVDSMRH